MEVKTLNTLAQNLQWNFDYEVRPGTTSQWYGYLVPDLPYLNTMPVMSCDKISISLDILVLQF